AWTGAWPDPDPDVLFLGGKKGSSSSSFGLRVSFTVTIAFFCLHSGTTGAATATVTAVGQPASIMTPHLPPLRTPRDRAPPIRSPCARNRPYPARARVRVLRNS
ncbi:hypothetical protein PMAYCL1PPCAC_13623, partial [Pristionchus mayeri]